MPLFEGGDTMKLELALLAWAVALAFAQMLIAACAATLQVGLPMLAGNRDDMPPRTGWAGRAQRAHLNIAREPGPVRRAGPGGGGRGQNQCHDRAGGAAFLLGAARLRDRLSRRRALGAHRRVAGLRSSA